MALTMLRPIAKRDHPKASAKIDEGFVCLAKGLFVYIEGCLTPKLHGEETSNPMLQGHISFHLHFVTLGSGY